MSRPRPAQGPSALLPRRLLAPLALVALALALPALAQTTYYEAWEGGLKHEKAREWEEARADFLKAKALRPESGKRVRSYGLNFIDGYDPDFRLARAALSLRLLDEAEAYLAKARANGVAPESDLATLQADLTALRAASSRAPASAAPAAPGASPAAAPRQAEAPAASASGTRASPPATEPPAVGSISPGAPPATRPDGVSRTAAMAFDEGRGARSPGLPGSAKVVEAGRATSPPVDSHPPGSASPLPSPSSPDRARDPLPTASAPRAAPGGASAAWPALGGAALVTVAAAGIVLALIRRRRLAGAPPGPMPDETSPTRITTGRRPGATDAPPWPSVGGPPGSSGQGEDDPFGASLFVASATKTALPFGDYVLEGVLGRGAMGSTWLARRTRDGLPVAVKVPHDHVLEQEDFVVRFRREGDLGATLHHPNVVQILETGERNGRPFIVMELIEGETLEKLLRREKRLDRSRALPIVREIALALDYTHMKGIVHRDLKPENVMVLTSGQVKVMDYGIARQADLPSLTASYGYLGTPLYSAPETVTPQEIDARSDLYSLGIILYRMLTGVLPFTGQHAIQLLHKHASEPLPPFPAELGLDRDLFSLVFELTAKSKEDRFPSAEHFLRELDRIIHLG